MAKALLIAQKTIERNVQQLRAKDRQIMELEPKSQALDDSTNVEDKLLARDATKILSNSGTPISEKQMREWMSDNDWIYKANGTKLAFPPTVRIPRKRAGPPPQANRRNRIKQSHRNNHPLTKKKDTIQ